MTTGQNVLTVQKGPLSECLRLTLVLTKIEVQKHTNTEGKYLVQPDPVTVSARSVMEVISQPSLLSSPLLFIIVGFDRMMPGFSHHTYGS